MKHFNIPKRNGQGLDFGTYTNMVSLAKKLSGLKFDPTQFLVQEDPTGIYVSTNFNTNAEEFTYHYKTKPASTTSFFIEEGYWRRNGELAQYANVAAFDPMTDNIIGSDYTGDIWNYVVRMQSDGETTGLQIINSGWEIPNNNNQFKVENLISTVHYETGKITIIDQDQIGDIDDTISLGKDLENFGLTVNKSDKLTVGVTVGSGVIRIRDQEFSVTGKTESSITSDKKIYIDLGTDSTTVDASLVPQNPQVKIEDNYPNEIGYGRTFIRLYELAYIETDLADGGSSSDKYASVSVLRFHFGDIKDDWMRPDGQDSGNGYIDTAAPKSLTLDFVTNGMHKGELQDYQFSEQVANNGLGAFSVEGDQVIPYYYWRGSAGDNQKTYGRIDAENASAHGDCGKSLHVASNNQLQLYEFFDGNFGNIGDVSTAGTAQYRFVMRDHSDTTCPELKYMDATAMKVPYCYTADTATYALTAETAVSAGTTSTALSAQYCETANTAYTAMTAIYLATAITATHAALDFTNGPTTGAAAGNLDHDYDYWIKGGDYNNAHGQSIGRSSSRSVGADNEAINLTDSLLKDVNGTATLDWNECWLYDSNHTKSVDWNQYIMYCVSGTATLNWNTCQLYSTDGTKSMDWSLRDLYDANATISVNYNDRQLKGYSGGVVMDWRLFPDGYILFGNTHYASGNEWRDSSFYVDVTGYINMYGGQDTKIVGGGINVTAAAFDMNLIANNYNAINIKQTSTGGSGVNIESQQQVDIKALGGPIALNTNGINWGTGGIAGVNTAFSPNEKIVGATYINGGLTSITLGTGIADGTYSNPTEIVIYNGIITSIT